MASSWSSGEGGVGLRGAGCGGVRATVIAGAGGVAGAGVVGVAGEDGVV